MRELLPFNDHSFRSSITPNIGTNTNLVHGLQTANTHTGTLSRADSYLSYGEAVALLLPGDVVFVTDEAKE